MLFQYNERPAHSLFAKARPAISLCVQPCRPVQDPFQELADTYYLAKKVWGNTKLLSTSKDASQSYYYTSSSVGTPTRAINK